MKILKLAKHTVSKFHLPPSLEFEDCVQELALRAIEKGICDKPASYLYRAFRNAMIDMLKKEKFRSHAELQDVPSPSAEIEVLDALMADEKSAPVLLAVAYNDGVMSSAADMMNMPRKTLERRYRSALTRLRAIHGV